MPAVVAQAVIDSSVNSIDQLREHGNELFRGGMHALAKHKTALVQTEAHKHSVVAYTQHMHHCNDVSRAGEYLKAAAAYTKALNAAGGAAAAGREAAVLYR